MGLSIKKNTSSEKINKDADTSIPLWEHFSKWKNKSVTYVRTSAIYTTIDTNILSPCRTLHQKHPVVYAVALAALSILVSILSFNIALSALKHVFSVIIPLIVVIAYSQLLWLMANKTTAVWQALQPPHS